MKYVVNSTDANLNYGYFMPLVCRLWKNIGYEPIALLLGGEQEWNTKPHRKYILEQTRANSQNVLFINRLFGFRDSTVTQMSRLFTAAYDFFSDKDYLLTSDVDMLPLNRDFFQQQDWSKDFHIFNADAYGGGKFPVCYLGGSVRTWRDIMKIPVLNLQQTMELSMNAGRDDWNYDEILFFERLTSSSEWPSHCQFIPREWPGGLARKRLDRAAWSFNGERDLLDCHSVRPGYRYWRLLAPLLKTYATPTDYAYFEDYQSWFEHNPTI